MWRLIRGIIAYLLLGAIVTVAVAWVCMASANPRGTIRMAGISSGISRVTRQTQFGVEFLSCDTAVSQSALLIGEEGAFWTSYPGNLSREEWARRCPATLIRAGWPNLALECWETVQGTPVHVMSSGQEAMNSVWADRGFVVPRFLQEVTGVGLLPVRPIPMNFFINAAFFGVCLFLLVHTASIVRSRIRVLRGRCAHCGYPRGSSPVCTECGEPLPARCATGASNA